MSKKKVAGSRISFRVSAETDAMVRQIAAAQGRNTSSVYRELIHKGLAAGGYVSGSEDEAQRLRTTLEGVLKPQIERLATISAKGSQLSAAAFFLAAYTARLTLPPEQLTEFDTVAAMARKLGIEYLKLSHDKSLDDFIRGGLNRLGRGD